MDYKKIYDLKIENVDIFTIVPRIKKIIYIHEKSIAKDQFELDSINNAIKKVKKLGITKTITDKYNIDDSISCFERDVLKTSVRKETQELQKFKDYVYTHFKYIS